MIGVKEKSSCLRASGCISAVSSRVTTSYFAPCFENTILICMALCVVRLFSGGVVVIHMATSSCDMIWDRGAWKGRGADGLEARFIGPRVCQS